MANRITPEDVATTARMYGVPPELALAIYDQESSGGRNTKTSPKGAVGGFQVIPDTFRRYMPQGNINNPVDNMVAGIKVLQDGLKKSGGDPEGAAQFYYHGAVLPPNVEGPTSGPGTPTTRQYGRSVVARMGNVNSNNPATGAPETSEPSTAMSLYGSGTPLPPQEEPPDIAGFTRPLDQGSDEWLQQMSSQADNELDRYVRNLVEQEFSNRAA